MIFTFHATENNSGHGFDPFSCSSFPEFSECVAGAVAEVGLEGAQEGKGVAGKLVEAPQREQRHPSQDLGVAAKSSQGRSRPRPALLQRHKHFFTQFGSNATSKPRRRRAQKEEAFAPQGGCRVSSGNQRRLLPLGDELIKAELVLWVGRCCVKQDPECPVAPQHPSVYLCSELRVCLCV